MPGDCWFEKNSFSTILTKNEFRKGVPEEKLQAILSLKKCIFKKETNENKVMILLLYVDDMIDAGENFFMKHDLEEAAKKMKSMKLPREFMPKLFLIILKTQAVRNSKIKTSSKFSNTSKLDICFAVICLTIRSHEPSVAGLKRVKQVLVFFFKQVILV